MITLLYHEISDNPHWLIDRFGITIRPEVFEMHMRVLEGRDVLVTFDDGYRSTVQYAGDILQKYNIKSIWNVNSGFWNNDRVFWLSKYLMFYPNVSVEMLKVITPIIPRLDGEYDIAQKADLYASPQELKSLNAEIGNHAYSHANLRNLRHSEIVKEVLSCHFDIHREIGIYPRSFAFPFGEYILHWNLDTIDSLKEFQYKRIFSVNNSGIKGVTPRYMVPNIDSETGFKEYLDEKSSDNNLKATLI